MAAILGLDFATVDHIAREVAGDEVVQAANDNDPGQVVISGEVAGVERAMELAKEAGVKRAVRLNVSGAFHSPLMEVALPGLEAALDAARLRDPAFPVYANVTAGPATTAADARALEEAMPRLQDLFTTYLREVRPDELRGSAGTYRLREELMARASLAAPPAQVTDVLFVELLLQ